MGALLERAAQEGAIAALLNALAAACWPGGELPPPLPPLRTNRTRRVLHPVLIGHAASCTPY